MGILGKIVAKGTNSLLQTVLNIIWVVFTGFWSSIAWFFEGLLWCITIVGIPFGLQAFKFADLTFAPFGKKVTANFNAHPIANVIWLIFGGFSLAIGYVFWGVFWHITIVGIPFGKQCFKLATVALGPFGAEID